MAAIVVTTIDAKAQSGAAAATSGRSAVKRVAGGGVDAGLPRVVWETFLRKLQP